MQRRLLGVYFAVIGPRAAYCMSGVVGRALYRLLAPFRLRSEAQCRAALGAELAERGQPPTRLGAPQDGLLRQQVARNGFTLTRHDIAPLKQEIALIAERAFVHRIWSLTDLLLAPRLLHPKTFERYGGRIPEPHRTEMLAAQQRRQPAILVSAYYGSYDLLPVFLGYNGVRAAAVYLPHGNAAFDELRRRVRARSGCELVPVERALERLPQVLAAGGNVAIVADHHDQQRGLPATFLGLPTRVSRSVGLLAWRYGADVVVAGNRRVGEEFSFSIEVMDVIKHDAWRGESDPDRVIHYVTDRYLRAIEALVRRDPAQYLWGYARWGEEFAQRLTAEFTEDR